MSASTVVFYLLALLTIGSALGVALSHNVVYSAFALMGALLGVAGTFVLLGADFLGVVQLLVYVGGILVLAIFAVMLTHRIADVQVSNRAVGQLPAAVLVAVVVGWMVQLIGRTSWAVKPVAALAPPTDEIGNLFLTTYVLPFEIASMVLLAALIGAVAISRKEVRG